MINNFQSSLIKLVELFYYGDDMKEKSVKIGKELLKGTLALSIAALVTKIFGVVYKIPLSHILTDLGMGYFNAAYTVYGFFFIVSTAGIPKAVTIILAELKAEGRESVEEVFLGAIIRKGRIVAIILSIAYIIACPIAARLIGSLESIYSLLALAPCVYFVTVGGIMRGYLNGNTRLAPIAKSQLIEAGIKLFAGLILACIGLRIGLSLEIISAMSIAGITIGCFVSYLYLKNKVKIKNTAHISRQRYTFSSYFKKMAGISVPITVSSALASIAGLVDLAIIINRLGDSGSDAVSLYGNYTTLAIPMVNLITSLLMPISVAYLSRLSSLKHIGDTSGFNTGLKNTIKLISIFSIPCAFAYYFYAFDLLDILFDTSSAAIGFEMLVFLSGAVILLPVLNMLNTALEACGRVHGTIVSLLVGIFVKAGLTYFFVGNNALGILGAPLATVIGYVVSILISSELLRRNGASVHSFIYIIRYSLISCLAFIPIFHLVFRSSSGSRSGIMTVFCCIISFLLYFGLVVIVSKQAVKELFIGKNTQK